MNPIATIPDATLHQLSADQVKAQVQVIQQVMKAVMLKGTHFGPIPGAGDKPTLFKAGSEVLLTTFRIAVEPQVEDLSTADEMRFRVKAVGRHQTTGIEMGAGVGEASSNEEKYRWRSAVCPEEFAETPEDRRRTKWKKGDRGPYQVNQVRTSPADVANTVLKMAKKRAQIDMCLTALAASDCFTQDLEDLPEEMRDAHADQGGQAAAPSSGKPATEAPRRRAEAAATGEVQVCTPKQAQLVAARLDASGLPEKTFLQHFGIAQVAELPFARVDAALEFIKKAVAP